MNKKAITFSAILSYHINMFIKSALHLKNHVDTSPAKKC